MPQNYSLRELCLTANTIRQLIINMLATAQSGHSAGALGMADVFTALYFAVMKHDPTQPTWVERDRLLLSNGHICPVLYASLAEAGYFPKTELATLRQLHSRLQGHPHLGSLPGVENTSGPLGQGISQACGVAHAFKLDHLPNHVYCVTSDAEHEEGQTWEAYQYAAKYQLDNLTVLIDRNQIQIEGKTEGVMPLEPFGQKLLAFGWQVQEINGNHIEEVIESCQNTRLIPHKPHVLICHTVPGKGVSFMERDYRWHGKPPTPEQAQAAIAELQSERERI